MSLRRSRFPYNVVLRHLPIRLVEHLRFEGAMAKARWAGRRTASVGDPDGVLVNLGSGTVGRPEWINVDGYSDERIDLVADLRHHVPLPDDSAAVVFTEHLVEHLEYDDEAPCFFAECMRILRPGGLLRVVVPDGEKFLRAYVSSDPDAFDFADSVQKGFETPMQIVNAHFRQGIQHRFSYDAETLIRLLSDLGFVRVERSLFGESRFPGAAIDSESRSRESLYVEANKPVSNAIRRA